MFGTFKLKTFDVMPMVGTLKIISLVTMKILKWKNKNGKIKRGEFQIPRVRISKILRRWTFKVFKVGRCNTNSYLDVHSGYLEVQAVKQGYYQVFHLL